MSKKILIPLITLVISLSWWTSLHLSTSQAQGEATITVTRFDDPTPRDNPASCLTVGNCSLREAILVANSQPETAYTINLTTGTYNLTVTGNDEDDGATGDLDIRTDLSIVGAGTTATIVNGLDGNADFDPSLVDRVFHVVSGNDVRFRDLTIQDGQTRTGRGGGILYSVDRGVLAVSRVRLINNRASRGGGIHNGGSEAIINVINSTLVSNRATNTGGGFDSSEIPVADVNIISSAIISNTADSEGGGIYFSSVSQEGERVVLNIINSTVSYNQAGEYGGGLTNRGNGEVNIQNSTIAFNRATTGADDQVGGGGGVAVLLDAQINASHSIIADNFDDGNPNRGTYAPDCLPAFGEANFNSVGHNLIGDTTNCDWSAQDTDLIDVSAPRIETTLTTVTGLPPVHRLFEVSPAVGQGSQTLGGALVNCTIVDQQGLARQNGCDIGAYQTNTGAPTVNLNLIKSGPDTVTELGQPITYTLSLINGSLVTATNVVITDEIPIGSFYVSGGERVGNIVQWETPQLPPSELFLATFVVTSNETVANRNFRVTADGFASDGFNDVGTTLVDPDLTISKRGPNFVPAGSPIVYTITVRNDGGRVAPSVVITDALPVGATYVSGGEYDAGTNTVRWEVGDLPSAQSGNNIVSVNLTVTAQRSLTNDRYGVVSNDGLRSYVATGSVAVVTLDGRYYLPVILQ